MLPDDGWKETTTHTFEGPYDGGVQHNLVLVVLNDFPRSVALKEWAKTQCDISSSLMPGFDYVDERESELPSGAKTYEIVYKYTPVDGVVLFQKQWFMIIGKKAYVFTSTFSKKTLSTIANDVAKIVASLKVPPEESDG